jgi:hypothetical protein
MALFFGTALRPPEGSAYRAPLPNAPGVTGSAGTTLAAGRLLWQAQSYNAWGKAE